MNRRVRVIGLLAAAATVAGGAGTAHANATDTSALQAAVQVGNDKSGIRKHLRAFQDIADLRQSNGTRSTGSYGHERSAEYVIGQMPKDYWTVTTQPFDAIVFTEQATPELAANPAADPAWVADTDYATMEFSGANVLNDAPIAVIDYVTPTTKASTSSAGCEDSDFPAGATSLADKIAVIQRGTCDFGLKALNAQKHGAAGVLIFNEGTIGDPDRQGLINGTIGGYGVTLPVLEGTYAVGKYLYDNQAATLHLAAFGHTDVAPTYNVIAESKAGDPSKVIISGAHLDSVPEGPGINDDGSGSAIQIETARQMAALNIKPRNRVRFIWFSGEEQGLLGSIHYAQHMTKAERNATLGMLDFDMLASPNYALQVYDGDGSEFGVAGPNGSGAIEEVFQDFYDARSLFTQRIAFDGRSDYDEFTTVGIPAGGIAAGAEVHKTLQEQEWWGGTVSEGLNGQYDPCYHLACDSYGVRSHPDNINDTALDINSDAVAHAVLTFAMTNSSTNGTTQGALKTTEWKGNHRYK